MTPTINQRNLVLNIMINLEYGEGKTNNVKQIKFKTEENVY